MHLLYAGKFDDIASLVTILAILPAVIGIGHTLNGALKAMERPDFVLYAYLCGGTVTFIGGIPLVMRYGLAGAVYGMLLSAAAYSIALGTGFLSLASRRPKTVPSSTI